ncbi:MAG TPA: VWA domain-containing protein [Candidatus Binatia bacterium]|nr:VWA domain-containing protein [Candidatus Binatia bacterium]
MISETLHFLRPAWLLALVPAALVVWAAARSSVRGSAWRRVVDPHLLRFLLLDEERPIRRWPLWALATGWIAAAVAMAGPTWERIPQPTWKAIQPTVVLLDTSPAMDVADLTPSRLAHARHKLQDVLDAAKGGQVALVLYADEPFVASPLTDDGRVIAEMVPSLTSGIMPGRQSRPDRALAAADALLAQAGMPGGNVVVLTASPGDDRDAAIAAARTLAAHGRKVSVLGVGTKDGAPAVDARARLVKDASGSPVVSRVDAGELGALASAGGGRFEIATPGNDDVARLLAEPLSDSTSDAKRASANADTWRDAGVWLLAIPLALAPLAFRRGWLVALALAVLLGDPRGARASTWDDLWATRDQQAQAALATGDPGSAEKLFEDPAWKAAAAYQGGAYDAAVERYAKLEGADNRYNLGNSLARAGKLEDAIAAYDEAIAQQPDHEDAKANRELVKRLLEQRKQKQQEQQKQQQQKNESAQGGGGQRQSEAQSGGGGDEQKDRQQNASASASEKSQADSNGGSHGGQDQGSENQTASQEKKPDEQNSPQGGGGDASASSEKQQQEGEPQAEAADAREQAKATASDASGRADDARRADAETSPPPRKPDEKNGDQPAAGESLADRVTRALQGDADRDAQSRSAESDRPAARVPTTEEEQAREQKLRQVPDDPGGLLRARIRRHFAESALARQ